MYNIKHKNKTPVRKVGIFKAILLFIYILCLLWRHSFLYFWITFPCHRHDTWILKSISAELYSSYFIIAYFPLVSTVSEVNSGTLVFAMQHLATYGTQARASGR